jgi:hypothetical protein
VACVLSLILRRSLCSQSLNPIILKAAARTALFLTIESVPIDLEPAALALYVDESPGDL